MDTIPENSIVNVHLKDGSSTGGSEFVGVHAPVPYDGSAGPELVLRLIDGGETRGISFDEIDWVDVLATPFRARDFEERIEVSFRPAELDFAEFAVSDCLDHLAHELDSEKTEVGKSTQSKLIRALNG